MPVVAGTPTIIINNFNVFEAIVPLTLSGSYPGTAAGDPLDFSGIVPSNSVPIFCDIKEIQPAGTATSGIKWDFAVGTTQANGALLAQIGAGFTPAGTNSAPTITTGTNATVTAVIATNGGALTQAAGQTGLTGVQAPVFTGTAVAAAAAATLGAVTYASVNASHLVARVMFTKFV